MDIELGRFFGQMFNVNVRQRGPNLKGLPTFEEALGLTDLAILRKETFRGFNGAAQTYTGDLRDIARYLVFLVAKVLDSKLKGSPVFHGKLVKGLLDGGKLKKLAFISTNYDILIDNALADLREEGIDLDYGVDFRNFRRKNDWVRPRPSKAVFLFKPHGSLNWLFCPTCNEIEITPREKGLVTHVITSQKACRACKSFYTPLVVPPTFYKDMSNVFLANIWNRIERELRTAKHIVFCGYSFPDADIHIKYLLKRGQTNRKNSPRFTVINHYQGKNDNDESSVLEKSRFTRFLGPNVNYTRHSFEDFASDPLAIIDA